MNPLTLELLPARFGLCRLLPRWRHASGMAHKQLDAAWPPDSALIPDWLQPGKFQCVVSTDKEISILCEEKYIPPEVKAERDWRGLRIVDSLDFTMVGVLASLLDPLAQAEISILALSTYDTDYVFVKHEQVDKAIAVLENAGFMFKTSEVNDLVA